PSRSARGLLMIDAMRFRSSFLLVSLLFTQACAPVRLVPPPAAPDKSMPALPGPLPEGGGGMARVVISTDVPARVERVLAVTEQFRRHHGTTEVPSMSLLCDPSPCV